MSKRQKNKVAEPHKSIRSFEKGISVIDVEEETKAKGKDQIAVLAYQPKLPYLTKVKKDQQDDQLKNFLEMFKTLHINIPFVEVLAQMARYAKFLKELLTNKSKLEEVSTMTLSVGCSAILTNKLLKKERGPWIFIMPRTIIGVVGEKELVDLGVSTNLMLYKIF